MPFRSFAEKEAAILAVKEAGRAGKLGRFSLYEYSLCETSEAVFPVCALGHIAATLGVLEESSAPSSDGAANKAGSRIGLNAQEVERILEVNDSTESENRAEAVADVLASIPVGAP